MPKLNEKTARELLLYNAETGQFIWRRRGNEWFGSERICNSWNSQFAGKPALNSQSSDGYLQGSIGGKMYKAHRVAWLMLYGEWPKDQIDHINMNREDNRAANLREATVSENKRNMSKMRNNTSGFKGVCYDKSASKWLAHITHMGKKRNLGRYPTPEMAHKAYCNAADRLHGQYARTS